MKYTQEIKDEMVQNYLDGYSSNYISQKYKCDTSVLFIELRKRNIKSRKNSDYCKLSKEQINTIEEKYNSGLSCTKISKLYNTSAMTITRILKKLIPNTYKEKVTLKRKHKFNKYYFESINNNNKAYVLGLLYADGFNNVERGQIKLALQERDKHILEDINKELESNIELRYRITNNINAQNCYELLICSRDMSNDLKELGCTQNKSLTLKLPKPEQVPLKFIPSFIRGYFDGDGSFWYNNVKYIKKNKEVSLYLSSQVSFVGSIFFANEFKILLKNILDINLVICQRKHGHKNIVEFSVGGNKQVLGFMNWIYKDSILHLNRKYNKYLEFKKEYKKKQNIKKSLNNKENKNAY